MSKIYNAREYADLVGMNLSGKLYVHWTHPDIPVWGAELILNDNGDFVTTGKSVTEGEAYLGTSVIGNVSKQMLDSLSSLKSQKCSISRRISDFNSIIGKEANKLLKEIPDADEDFHFREIDEELIMYEKSTYGGRDWNNQDIYDIDEFYLPVELLYDEDFKTSYIKKIEDDKLAAELKQKERELERQKEKEFKERKQYLELKAKFEGSGDEK